MSNTIRNHSDRQRVILVDQHDHELGSEEKLRAHQSPGQLHRAFSIFLFHPDGRMLLQQRARTKYHFPLLWTNACCGHPAPGQTTPHAARLRLREEIGLDANLTELFTFTYQATDPASGLTENELDHVFAATITGRPQLIDQEAEALQWMTPQEIHTALAGNPQRFTPWFRLVLERVLTEAPHRLALPAST
jgi:isopentenyl-diphosphate delta-isomerase